MIPYVILGIVAFTLTFVATPAVRWLSARMRVIDHPGDRKVHARPTPTLGGVALFIGIIGAGVAAYFMRDFKDVFTRSSEALGIAAGAIVIFTLGALDDLRTLPAPVKLSGQVFASGVVFLLGARAEYILLPSNLVLLSPDVSALVTVIWLVAMINAVNLVDGLDGLAAGIVAIAGAAFFVYTFQLAGTGVLGLGASAPLVAIVIVGAALGFLRYNFHPATIFMGDSGSMLLGLVLGAATVVGVGRVPAQPSNSVVFLAYFPLLVPLLVLAIPLADGVFAIIRRARRRRSIFQADKEHLHHRLMDLGHGHREAVIVMYVWSALAAGAALAFSFLDRSNLIFAFPVAVGAIVLYTLFPLVVKVIQDRLTF